MKFQEFAPPQPLQPYIHHYAILEDHRDHPAGLTECTPPNLCNGLLFYYRLESPVFITNGVYDTALPQSFMLPQCFHSQHWLYHKPIAIFAIMFKPGKLRYFFPYPLLEYLDRTLPISDCEDKALHELEQRILEAQTTDNRIKIANDFFLSRLCRVTPKTDYIDWSLQQLFANPEMRIKDLPSKIQMSERHFRRCFEREMGINPKSWQKLARFSQSLYLLQNRRFQKLSDVAYRCGYSDPSEFIEQFKFFTGLTPTQFLKEILPITALTAWREEVIDSREINV
jgi:AraC-like DNA-binding protein